MRPRVAGDLMARRMHALDELRVARRSIVYLAFSHVIASDEKRRLGIVLV